MDWHRISLRHHKEFDFTHDFICFLFFLGSRLPKYHICTCTPGTAKQISGSPLIKHAFF